MSDADYVVLARAGRQIIGLTYADQGEYEYMDSATYIEYCVVLDTYRGRGIGKAMMDTLLDGCRENGVKTVVLHVNAENEKARALYNKAGYNTIGYVMAKNI